MVPVFWHFLDEVSFVTFFVLNIFLQLMSLSAGLKPSNSRTLVGCLPTAHLVSISLTFYEQIFRKKVFCAAFNVLTIWVCNFWQKDFGAKVTNKMSVKLTPALSHIFNNFEMLYSSLAYLTIKVWLFFTLIINF